MSKKIIKTGFHLNKKRGIFFATGTLFFQGFEGILLVFFGFLFVSKTIASIEFASAILFSKEIICLFFTFLIFGPKVFKSLYKKIKTKEAWLIFSSGAFGTALGNIFYILAISFASSSYGTILNSLYPIFSLLILRIFEKQKQNKMVWIGAFITILSSMLFLSVPLFFIKNKLGIKEFIGIFFGLFAGLFWALDSFLINKATRMKNSSFMPKEIIVLKTISSIFITFFLIIPISFISGNPFKWINNLFINWESVLILISISLNVILIRNSFLNAIKNIGIGTTTIIDSNSFLITPIISLILSQIPGMIFPDGEPLFIVIDWWTWFLAIPIIVGVFMVVKFNKEHNKEKEILPHVFDI